MNRRITNFLLSSLLILSLMPLVPTPAAAAAYGLKSNSSSWNEIKVYDSNNDGEISIVDLVNVECS
ncbi:hypothetical protein [Paenibacillus foliorum]|uniref:hypothetical protein n=1 Tax=Paenibacillus foliorum TaxID=2654974 RepID=UPI001C0FE2AD|nr:hypothetical protein [Paenibacillus foliorum]